MLLLKMRSGIFSYIFLGLLIFGGAGLVLMDWTGTYRFAGGSNDVLTVGDQSVKSAEFDRLTRRILRTQQMDPQTAYQTGMIDQIVEFKMMDLLLKKAAHDNGIVVDDKEVSRQVHAMLKAMPGEGDKKQILARLLQSQGMSEAELVENLRNDIATKTLRESITRNFYIPSEIAQDLFDYRHEQRAAEIVSIPFTSAADVKPADDKALETYYDTVKGAYMTPELRSFTMAVATPEALAGSKAEITDADIKAFYDENKDSFKVDERRLLQQAVLDSEAKAQSVLKEARDKKKSLQDSVKSVTGDTKAYTGENGFEKAGLPQQLADAIFSAKEGDFVGPIKSPLGWHVAFIKSIQAPQIQPLDKVSAEIRKELQGTKDADALYAATSKIEDRLAAGEALADIAKDMNMTLVPVKDVNMAKAEIPALKAYDKDQERILQSVFSLQEGENSSMSELSDGKMFIVHVDTVTARAQKNLKDVKDAVAKQWLEDQQRKATAAYAKDALEKLEKKSITLAEIAKQKNGKVQNFSGLSRDKEPSADLGPTGLGILMSAGKGKPVVIPTKSGLMIGQVTSIQTQTQKPTDKDISEVQQMLGNDMSQEQLLSMVSALQKDYKTSTNRKLLEQMYGAQADEGAQP